MKAIYYELNFIHKTNIVIAARNREEIEETLRRMIAEGEIAGMNDIKVDSIVAEEKEERECMGNCDECQYFCPSIEDCMMDEVEERCEKCRYLCPSCGDCALKGGR